MSDFLTSHKDITMDWLNRTLGIDNTDHKIKEYSIALAEESTMASIASINITYENQPASLPSSIFIKMAKLNSSGQPTGSGRSEVHFYKNLTGVLKPGAVPQCYYAYFDEDSKHYTIVLENISATHENAEWAEEYFYDQCCLAFDSLAEIHAAWWDHPEIETRVTKKRTSQDCAKAIERYRGITLRFLDANGDTIPQDQQDVLQEFAQVYEFVDKRFLSNRNISLVHRDAHFYNFMYPKNRVGNVYIIDWDSWRIDVPTNDIAYFMATHWNPILRTKYEQRLLKRYYENLLSHGIQNYTFEMLMDDYKISVLSTLYLAPFQWAIELSDEIWRPNLECICLALKDLNCMEVVKRLAHEYE